MHAGTARSSWSWPKSLEQVGHGQIHLERADLDMTRKILRGPALVSKRKLLRKGVFREGGVGREKMKEENCEWEFTTPLEPPNINYPFNVA